MGLNLDAWRFTEMPASDRAFTVHDLHNVLHGTDVGVRVKRWLHCGDRGRSVLRLVGLEVACSFVRCYGEVEYEKDLSTLVLRFHGQALLTTGLFLVL